MALSAASLRSRAIAGAPAALTKLTVFLLVAAVCVTVGALIAYLPWWLVLAVAFAPAVVLVGAVWPFPVLLLALALIFEAIPGRIVPPVGSFRIHELIILYLTVLVPFRAAWNRENPLRSLGPFLLPLIYLYVCVLVSAAYVKFFAPNPSLLAELRSFVVWLVLPLLAYCVKTETQRRRLMAFIAFVAIVVSIYVLIQSFVGVSILANRSVILDNVNSDVTRSFAGGTTYLMVFTLLWSINMMTNGSRWLLILLFAAIVTAGGIAVGYGRGVWVATALGFMISTWINRGVRGMLLSTLLAAISLMVLMVAFYAVKPRVVETVVERALGVSKELSSGGSFRWRQLENEYALAALSKRPLTGVGIGGEYKTRVSAVGTFANETQYIHNAYIGIMVKMGAHALLFPIWIVMAFTLCARRTNRAISTLNRPLFGAVVGSFFVPVITSVTQPEWISLTGVAALSVFIASLWLLERPLRGPSAGYSGVSPPSPAP